MIVRPACAPRSKPLSTERCLTVRSIWQRATFADAGRWRRLAEGDVMRLSYILGDLGATALAAVLVAQPSAAAHRLVRASVSSQRDSEPASRTANGIIVGVVVNERNEPVPHARVHAFPAHAGI